MQISPINLQSVGKKKILSWRSLGLFSLILFALAFGFRQSIADDSKSIIKVGDKAPEFTLPAQDGTDVSLKDYLGKKAVVLYFYPRDNSPICTKEACSFRDSFSVFTDAGAEVLGVSSDGKESHQDFATKHNLPFKLLSDTDGKVRKLYGIHQTLGMVPGRVTYVIDKAGIVRLSFNSQIKAEKHVSKALKILKELDKT